MGLSGRADGGQTVTQNDPESRGVECGLFVQELTVVVWELFGSPPGEAPPRFRSSPAT